MTLVSSIFPLHFVIQNFTERELPNLWKSEVFEWYKLLRCAISFYEQVDWTKFFSEIKFSSIRSCIFLQVDVWFIFEKSCKPLANLSQISTGESDGGLREEREVDVLGDGRLAEIGLEDLETRGFVGQRDVDQLIQSSRTKDCRVDDVRSKFVLIFWFFS